MKEFFKKIVNFIFQIKDEEELTAKIANTISRFNLSENISLDELLKRKIKEINSLIMNKLQYSNEENLVAIIIPNKQEDLFDKVRNNFSSRGFKTFIISSKEVPELKENKYLFISWDIDLESDDDSKK